MVGVALSNSSKSDDKEQLVIENSGDILLTIPPIKSEQDEITLTQVAAIRRKQASVLLGCLSALFMLGCLVIGSWLLFDFINRPANTWRRTCRYRLKPMEQNSDNRPFFDHGGLVAFDDGKNQLLPVPTKPNEFQQEVNVDLKKNTETIEVPQIGFTSNIRIIEDFDRNLTVIRDFGVNKCFIMPLDRQHVPNPANLIETFMAMMSGQFLPDNEVLRKTMKVQMPPLTETEVAQYGRMIASTCSSDIQTFRLVPKTDEELKATNGRQRRSAKPLTYMYSVGQRAIWYDIDDIN